MSTEVQAPELRRRPQRPRAGQVGEVVRSALASAPERLLLAFLVFCYVAAVAYVGGFFRPIIVFPATLVFVALTWRFLPVNGPRGARSAWGSALSMGVAGAWFLLNLPYLAERVHVGRDPDVYTLTALWLRNHSSLSIPVPRGSSESSGFYLVDGVLQPQGNHLVAGVSASVGWLFGQTAVFWGNLACGAAALLALYVLGRRLIGPIWSLVPMLALAVSLPMLEFSRAMYSEPLAMTFTLLGATLLWSAWKSDRLTEYVVAGAAFGGVALARIDGTLPLIGVIGGLALSAVVHPGATESPRRWAAPAVLLGSLPGVLLGFADLYFHSGRYIADLSSQFSMLGAGLAIAAFMAFAGAVVPAHRLPVVIRVVSRAAIAGAALSAVAFLVLLSRPWWYEGHGDNIPLVAGLQGLERSPVDGTRTYAEASFQWVSWYYGWPVILVGLGGLLAWLVVGTRQKSTQLLWLSALLLPSAALYFTQPSIVPDQIWAMRRFLPVVVPGLLLATAWIARRLSRLSVGRRPVGAILAALLVVCVLGFPLRTTAPLWSAKDNAGGLDGIQQLCKKIDGRPTIVTQQDTYLPTILALCDVPAFSVPEPSPAGLAAARGALGGGPAVLVTHTPDSIPWVGSPPPPSVVYTQTIWARSLTKPPAQVVAQQIGVTLGLVRPDGSVAPLTTTGG
jgi:hypothetical protein